MTSIRRSIQRKLRRAKHVGYNEALNRDWFQAAMKSDQARTVMQEHATKGVRAMSKDRLYVRAMTHKERWDKLIAPVLNNYKIV